MHTQYVLIERAGKIDVDQLAVIQSQSKDLTSKSEIVQMVWVDRGVTVGLKCSACKIHTRIYPSASTQIHTLQINKNKGV